ncbi:MAG: site-specific DNA-methyltransferase [Verrucomicrobia bacterium]|nr:site-specific DNA-methyltransferase [Verrucomicrobiota bacterium]
MKAAVYFETKLGRIYNGDSLDLMRERFADASVDLIMTSPPFGLVRKKSYGNVQSEEYVAWFKQFGHEFKRILKDNGSLVIDIGGAWMPGQPTRSLYQYELLIMLCKEIGFHLAQEFFWWNPARLPTPAEWVTVRRVRCKDAINCLWWLSPTPWPKASNRRVLAAYSDSMHQLLRNGYNPKLRPSGHDISDKFGINNGGSIPPNLLAFPNTESNSHYLKYCTEYQLTPHPARFPSALPEFFIRMLTNKGDFVFDPFGGSCVTGETAERMARKWACCDLDEGYVKGAKGRFLRSQADIGSTRGAKAETYSVPNPLTEPCDDSEELSVDGGKVRAAKRKAIGNGLHTPRIASPMRGDEDLRRRKALPTEQMRLLEEPMKYKAKRK